MLKTIYIDSTGLKVTIDSFLKHCSTCMRLTPYKIRILKSHGRMSYPFGLRLCWEHLLPKYRTIIEGYYLGI